MNDDEIMRKRKWRVRTHGCKYPLHPWQISSWAFYLFDISGYYLVVMVPIKHNSDAWIILTIILTLLFFILGVLDIKSTIVNPTDKIVKMKNIDNQNGKYQFYWKIWDSHVSDNSKHCGQWNRWVENFDHHWKWLNNWIGEINYRLFILLWISVLLFQVFYIIWCIFSVVEISTNFQLASSSIKDVYGSSSQVLFIVLIVCIGIVNAFPLVAIFNLLLFHFWLYK